MLKIKSYIFLMLLFITFNVRAESAFQELDSLLSTFKSMSADFNQTSIVKKQVAKQSTGTMALQRPGKFRWEIVSPNHQVIIADGKYLWVYDIDLEQATRTSLTKDAHSPAILLSGSTSALEERFTIIDMKKQGDQTTFQLKPKRDQDMVQRVELQFANKKLKQMSVVDNLGQKNIFDFTNAKINPTLSNNLFVFRAPKDVDIIKN